LQFLTPQSAGNPIVSHRKVVVVGAAGEATLSFVMLLASTFCK